MQARTGIILTVLASIFLPISFVAVSDPALSCCRRLLLIRLLLDVLWDEHARNELVCVAIAILLHECISARCSHSDSASVFRKSSRFHHAQIAQIYPTRARVLHRFFICTEHHRLHCVQCPTRKWCRCSHHHHPNVILLLICSSHFSSMVLSYPYSKAKRCLGRPSSMVASLAEFESSYLGCNIHFTFRNSVY
jgi:hypothetical protein